MSIIENRLQRSKIKRKHLYATQPPPVYLLIVHYAYFVHCVPILLHHDVRSNIVVFCRFIHCPGDGGVIKTKKKERRLIFQRTGPAHRWGWVWHCGPSPAICSPLVFGMNSKLPLLLSLGSLTTLPHLSDYQDFSLAPVILRFLAWKAAFQGGRNILKILEAVFSGSFYSTQETWTAWSFLVFVFFCFVFVFFSLICRESQSQWRLLCLNLCWLTGWLDEWTFPLA